MFLRKSLTQQKEEWVYFSMWLHGCEEIYDLFIHSLLLIAPLFSYMNLFQSELNLILTSNLQPVGQSL